ALMRFLTEYGLVAPAILSLARRTELAQYKPKEAVMIQGKTYDEIFFLVEGRIQISIYLKDRNEVVGERGPVTLLGEISYFNKIPATANVHITGREPAHVLTISYENFSEVINEYPQIKPTLTRIGDMRVISQKDGFSSFTFFMDMIGWKRDRLALNRSQLEHLEETVIQVLMPRLPEDGKLLDVGDGPGIVCEVIHELDPERLNGLSIQATHLEEAILNPTLSYPSDFSRTKYLREKFEAITALQIFEHLPPGKFGAQFEAARRLLKPDGHLLVIRLRVVDVVPASGAVDTSLIFDELSLLVKKNWPGILQEEDLVKVSFVDADIDPMMEWNPKLSDLAAKGELTPAPDPETFDGALMKILMEQASRRAFNPEEILFHLLIWNASKEGFQLVDSKQSPEIGFYYQLYQLAAPMELTD
ncbi:MAG: cyclic nucleotide-binding domain-containing protein, partial [bacterium]